MTANRSILFVTGLVLVVSCLLMPSHAFAHSKSMSVQIRSAQLRSAPGYLSRIVTKLDYATRVTILETRGDWLKVQAVNSSLSGWLHKSALTKKRLKLSAGNQDISNTVTTDEQALAGKGFNSDVEAQFKKENKDIDFTWVDKMEKIKVPPAKIKKFLMEGDIKPQKEAVK